MIFQMTCPSLGAYARPLIKTIYMQKLHDKRKNYTYYIIVSYMYTTILKIKVICLIYANKIQVFKRRKRAGFMYMQISFL